MLLGGLVLLALLLLWLQQLPWLWLQRCIATRAIRNFRMRERCSST